MSDWTDERESELKSLAAKKLSSGQIAAEMGITRNAVIGKLRRLGVPLQSGLAARPLNQSPPREKVKRIRRRAVAVQTQPQPQLEAEPIPLALEPYVEGTGISFFDISAGQCRYPLNEVTPITDFRFCGDEVLPDCSWCAHHFAIVTPAALKPRRVYAYRESRSNGCVQ